MNAYAILAVNDHLEYLLAEAAANRAVKAGRPSLRKRLVSAIEGLIQDAERTIAAGQLGPVVKDYPTRS